MLAYIRKHWFRRGQGGWTVAELMMTLAISSVGIGAALTLLNLGQRHAQRGDAVTALQQHTRTAIEWMLREARESASNSIVITGTDNSAIAFASARNADSQFVVTETGRPAWQQAIVYYLKPGTTHLYRYTTPKTNWAQNFDPTSVIEQGLGEKISEQVSSLSFSLDGSLLSVTIETIQETESGATATGHLETHTVIRNEL